MSASVISWVSIALLHNTIKTLNFLFEREHRSLPCVSYRAKVKLHGTNSAVQRTDDGVFPQSRTTVLMPGMDNKGFGEWVRKNENMFLELSPGTTVFGEWCGPGVEKGMAVSELDRKVFSIFAVQHGSGESATLEIEPSAIAARIPTHPDIFILPWYGEQLNLDFARELDDKTEFLNSMVEAVEREDPWVKSIFGIKGIGEGLVFYPILEEGLTPDKLSTLGFKAKGNRHRTVKTKKAVQVNPEVAENALSFAKLVVTEARLEQGVTEACVGEYKMKHTGALLQWIERDVQKECQAELEKAELTWKQVSKFLGHEARDWYRKKAS